MQLTLIIHVLAGALGLLSGYVALGVSKGAPLHRKTGMFFVYVMVTMAVTGALVSAAQGVAPAINIPTALLTFYLVITGMTSVGSPAGWSRRFDQIAMLFGYALAAGCLVLAVVMISRGGRTGFGFGFPLVMFGTVALVAATGDRRVLHGGPLKGAPRLMRHLWRMCFALFVSSIAFYLGPDRLPEALRSPIFRAAAVLLPLVAIGYWKWRLRGRKPVGAVVRVTAPEAI
jgi:uncharacterized membrane protein